MNSYLLDTNVVSEMIKRWGILRATHPRTLPYLDSLIAATALVHDLTLVTRNITDFADIKGIHLLNPWDLSPA
jgi:predicted nucleic acid-binding protein